MKYKLVTKKDNSLGSVWRTGGRFRASSVSLHQHPRLSSGQQSHCRQGPATIAAKKLQFANTSHYAIYKAYRNATQCVHSGCACLRKFSKKHIFMLYINNLKIFSDLIRQAGTTIAFFSLPRKGSRGLLYRMTLEEKHEWN